jgi:putative polyhydroxyalkanoate system protein
VPNIHITREHSLGLAAARKLAFRWAETAEQQLEMECVYEEGKSSDLVTFTRPGVNGELKVTKDSFVLDARLGMLLGVFKDRIESEIVKNLDKLLDHKDPVKAFDKGIAKHNGGKPTPRKKA